MSAEGLLIAALVQSDLEKEAGIASAFRRGIGTARRHMTRRNAAVGLGAIGVGGAGFAAGHAMGQGKGIKTRGGVLFILNQQNRQEFFKILKAQGPVAAARFALKLVKSKQAKFERGASKIAFELPPDPDEVMQLLLRVDDGEKLACDFDQDNPMEKLAFGGKALNAIKAFANNVKSFAKSPEGQQFLIDTAGKGAILAGGLGLLGLGAEVVDQSVGGVRKGVRMLGKERRYNATKQWVTKLTPPDQLSAMGLASSSTALGPTSPEARARLEADRRKREGNFRMAFDLMDRYAPLTTNSPVVTALVLRDVMASGAPPNKNQIKDMLDLERSMIQNKTMSPFRLRADPKTESNIAGEVAGGVLKFMNGGQ